MAVPSNKLRIGIVGAGEVAQVIHLPTLALLSHLYEVTGVCDISRKVGRGFYPFCNLSCYYLPNLHAIASQPVAVR